MADKQKPNSTDTASPGERRSDILSVEFKSKNELYAAYMPFVKNGGLFIATNKTYTLGEEVFLLLRMLDDPEKHSVAAKVIWITPKRAQGRRHAGIGIQFVQDQTGLRNRIETYLAGMLGKDQPTDTI